MEIYVHTAIHTHTQGPKGPLSPPLNVYNPTHTHTPHTAQPGHVSGGAILFLLGLVLFWVGLAGRLNFQLLSCWLGPSSPVLFDGRVPRVRVEIFSDGVSKCRRRRRRSFLFGWLGGGGGWA
jgi:hypothetical protein